MIFPLFLAGVAVLAGRLYTIQVRDRAFFIAQARKQSEATVVLPAMRGTLYDCNGEALAFSLNTPVVFADPGVAAVSGRLRTWLPDVLGVPKGRFRTFVMRHPDLAACFADPTLQRVVRITKRLAADLGAPEEPLLAKLRAAMDARLEEAARAAAPVLDMSRAEMLKVLRRDSRYVVLRRPATEACAEGIRALGVRGLCVRQEPVRRAAEGLRIGQWLGFVGAEGRGLEGLELRLEAELRGTPGEARLDRDGRGKRFARSADPARPPRHGRNLYLTVDRRIQSIVDEELESVFSEFRPVSASAIVMEPDTGRILAMGSEPGLDLSQRAGMSGEELRRRLRNHPVQSVYEYGSTFKPFVAAAALELGVVTPDTMIDCENGVWKYRARTLHDSHPHGVMSVTDVVVHSSNIGMAKVGLKLGGEAMRQYVSFYHFGRRLEVGLPAEEGGIVTPAQRWTYYSTTSVPMGQEVAGTPLQLVTAFCSLVNGGRLMRPYIVEALEDPNTGEGTCHAPQQIERVLSPETSATMRSILAQVVERGTGRRLKDAAFRMGGKTGTAQKRGPGGGYSNEKFIGSFVGFAPVDEPRICVLVMVDEPKGGAYYGGIVAAPAVGRIIDRTLALLQSAPGGPASGLQVATGPQAE